MVFKTIVHYDTVTKLKLPMTGGLRRGGVLSFFLKDHFQDNFIKFFLDKGNHCVGVW